MESATSDPGYSFGAIWQAIKLGFSRFAMYWIPGAILLMTLNAIPGYIAVVHWSRPTGKPGIFVAVEPGLIPLMVNMLMTALFAVPFGILTVALQRIALNQFSGARRTGGNLLRWNQTTKALSSWWFLYSLAQTVPTTSLYLVVRHVYLAPRSTDVKFLSAAYGLTQYLLWMAIFTPVLLTSLLIVEKQMSWRGAIIESWRVVKPAYWKLTLSVLFISLFGAFSLIFLLTPASFSVGLALLISSAAWALQSALQFTFPAVVFARLYGIEPAPGAGLNPDPRDLRAPIGSG